MKPSTEQRTPPRTPPRLPSPAGRPARVRGVALASLGGLDLPSACVQLVRVDGADVLCVARPGGAGNASAFVSTAGAAAVYHAWPTEAPLSPGAVEALRTLCRGLAERVEARALPRGGEDASPSADGVVAGLPTPEGVRVVQGPRTPWGLSLTGETARGRVTVGLCERRPGEPGVLGWSLWADEAGDPDAALREAVRGLALAQIAAVEAALGAGTWWGPHVTGDDWIEVDLGAPIDGALAALAAGRDGPRSLTVRVAVPSRCACRCAFCAKEAPPAPAPVDAVLARAGRVARALRPAATGGRPVKLVLVGDDVLGFDALPGLLDALGEAFPEGAALITPGTRLGEPGVVETLVACGLPLTVSVTLHGPDAATHDRVAGLVGAWQGLLSGLERCRAAGVPVQVAHVLTADALGGLPDTLRRAAALSPEVHLLAFTPDAGHRARDVQTPGYLAATLPPPRAVRDTLRKNRALLEAQGIVLEGFAPCLVPPALRERAHDAPHSRPDPPDAPPAACTRCTAWRTRCSGPARGVLQVHGDAWARPLETGDAA